MYSKRISLHTSGWCGLSPPAVRGDGRALRGLASIRRIQAVQSMLFISWNKGCAAKFVHWTWHLHAITFISLTLTELVWEILFKVTPNLFVLERSNSINSGACAPLRFLFRSCRLNLCCCSEMQKKNKGYVLLQHLQTGMTTSVTRSNERVHFSF